MLQQQQQHNPEKCVNNVGGCKITDDCAVEFAGGLKHEYTSQHCVTL